MNDSNWLLFGLAGIGAVLASTARGREAVAKSADAVRDVVQTPIASSPTGAKNLRLKAAKVAREQLTFWAGRKETHPEVQKRLLSYWMRGGNLSEKAAKSAIVQRLYWSAVFIGFVMREAGAGINFKYSTFHTGYCAAAKRNRISQNTKNPFWLFRPSEHAPRVGDLLCNAREGSGVTFDNVDDGRSRASHCDVVVSVSAGRLEVVGGNLDDTVSRRFVRINAQGFVSSAEFYAVLRVGAA